MSGGSKYVTKDSGTRETFSTGMVRDTGAKELRPDLVYGPLLVRWAELMGRGAIKYGERNWEKASTAEELARFKASAFRHFMQWFYGLDTTEDHAAAVLFNIAGAEYVKDRVAPLIVMRAPVGAPASAAVEHREDGGDLPAERIDVLDKAADAFVPAWVTPDRESGAV